jgi:hypothetical protein
MTDSTPRAAAPLMSAAQAQKHVTHNEALYAFDALLCARFLDRNLTAPPSSPSDGDVYLVKATATGAWTGQNGNIAYYADGAWRFYPPFAGLIALIADETKFVAYDGSTWQDFAALLALENLPMLGVNATADSTNKLAVQSNAALFTDQPTSSGGTGDVRVTLSKQASGNTASFVYQDNFSGRAEMGLAGDDDFHFKVSPDGSTWKEALKIAASSGVVSLPLGQLKFPSTPNLSSDPNTLDDYEEGTFTPALATSGTAPSGVTSSAAVGLYIKIGSLVFITARLVLTSKGTGATGNARLSGLPFACSAATSTSQSINIRVSNVTFSSGYSASIGVPSLGTTLLGFSQIGSGLATAGLDWGACLSNTSDLGATGCYAT